MTIHPLRYAGIYVIGVIAMGILSVGLAMLIGVDLKGAAAIVPTIAAAMIEGQKQGAASGRKFDNAEAWRAAGIASMMVIGVNMIIGAVLFLLPATQAFLSQVGMGLILGAILFALAIQLAANRWFLQMGARAGAEKTAS
ncbi:MAG: ABZJ_00895 family protein [Maritimibacter sp.]